MMNCKISLVYYKQGSLANSLENIKNIWSTSSSNSKGIKENLVNKDKTAKKTLP